LDVTGQPWGGAIPRWPVGEWHARYGDFASARAGRRARPRFDFEAPTPQFLATLPLDPSTLLEGHLARGASSRTSLACLCFGRARGLLTSGLASAALRSAICSALLRLDGVALREQARNADGREVLALTLSDRGVRADIYLDQRDGQCAGERRETLEGDSSAGLPPHTPLVFSSIEVSIVDVVEAG
jgi:hypothetical protein